MGDMADMALDGVLCEWCGQVLDEEGGCGFPSLCPSCQKQKDTEDASNVVGDVNEDAG